MAGVLSEEGSVLGQDCAAAGMLAGKLRIEKYHTAENRLVAGGKYALEEGHAEKQNLAVGVHIVEMDTGAVHIDAGRHYVLVEAAEIAAAGTVALAGLVEIVDIAVLPVGLGELADTAASVGLAVGADSDALGIVDCVDIVAQNGLVVIVAEFDTVVLDTVGSADTAGAAGTVGLVHTVEIVDNAGHAADTAGTLAATDWQPCLKVVTTSSCSYRQ